MATTYHFKTNTLLKNLIGKDLINDDNIAIVELIKNGYDAGSPSARVRFENLSEDGKTKADSSLIVEDQGAGMALLDIKDKWLNIAYSEKKLAVQEHGAYFAGNKGVGRFSCDRLGTKLDLVTRRSGSGIYHMPINWLDFEVEGKRDLVIQDIPVQIHRITDARAAKLCSLDEFPKQGTVLVIGELRSAWNRERLLALKRALEKFLNPNQLYQRDAFKIRLQVPNLNDPPAAQYHEKINGQIRNQVFEKLKFNTTFIESHLSAREGTVRTELHHDGAAVFKLVESSGGYEGLEDVRIFVYYLNPYKKAYFARQTGMRAVDFGSIFLFLNGFRVAPYGDHGDDWLGLEVRRGQGSMRFLAGRDIIGRIEVSDSGHAFQPVSSREGLKNTPPFSVLRHGYFRDVLKKLERFVVDGLEWDSVPASVRSELKGIDGLDWTNTSETYVESWERKRQRIALSIMALIGGVPAKTKSFWFNPGLLEGIHESRTDDVRDLLAQIDGTVADKADIDLKKGLRRIRAALEERDHIARAAKAEAADLRSVAAERSMEVSRLEVEKETYRAATLFMQSVAPTEVKDLVAFHHQINHDATIAGNFLAKAIRALQQIPNSKPIVDLIQKAALANRRVATVAQFASKANFRLGMKKEPTDVPAFIEQYLLNVARDFTASSLRVTVNNHVNESFELNTSRVELSILVDNLVSNAGKAQAKSFDVDIRLVGANNLDIRFADDGKGMSPAIVSIDDMFEMGMTTTSGSGLGLFHARRIAEALGGKLSAGRRATRGMEFRLELTR